MVFKLAPTDFDSKYRTTQLSGKVSGPVIRDRMWFIASYQYSRTLIARTGIDLPRDFDGHYVLGKLTYSPNASHRFTLLGQTDPTTIDNTDQSTRFINPEAQGSSSTGWMVVFFALGMVHLSRAVLGDSGYSTENLH